MRKLFFGPSALSIVIALVIATSAVAQEGPRPPREAEHPDGGFEGWAEPGDWDWYVAGGGGKPGTCTKYACKDCLPNIYLQVDECVLVSRAKACDCDTVLPKGATKTVCRLKGVCTWVIRV